MKNSETFAAGVDFTTDSFLLDTHLVHRKTKTEYVNTPNALIQRTTNTYHAYDLSTNSCKSIDSKTYYELLNLYESTGGLTKKGEEYLYDRAIDNSFVMYCLLTSRYM